MTEIIYALGAQRMLVGVDSTSEWPEAARSLPKVGYFRALSAEGILSLAPQLLLATSKAGPPAVIEQLRATGLNVVKIDAPDSPAGVIEKVRRAADVLAIADRGESLIEQIRTDFAHLSQLQSETTSRPRVAFLFAVTKDQIVAAGTETAADAMIALGGGDNVFAQYIGYKPVNGEALIQANPDVLLVTERIAETLGGVDQLRRLPGITMTSAWKNKRLIVMDTLYLLGFGPRTGQAAVELTRALHPELTEADTHE